MPASPAAIAKADLRRRMTTRREALSAALRASAATRVAERLLALPELAGAGAALVCLSFGSELDTGPTIERLTAAGKRLFVPRAVRGEGRLHVHPFPCPLETLGFGLRQPTALAAQLEAGEIDREVGVALVAGLAFDRRGYRLGYGGGYFDRFLAAHPLIAIGLGFDQQLVDELSAETHDVPMDLVVSPGSVWRRRSAVQAESTPP